jgi:hypothetical protein
MTDQALVQQIAQLLEETGNAHHQAFIETDGYDPEWPLWYADYTHRKLETLLDAQFTRRELADLLTRLDKEQNEQAPSVHWSITYAQAVIERFSPG